MIIMSRIAVDRGERKARPPATPFQRPMKEYGCTCVTASAPSMNAIDMVMID